MGEFWKKVEILRWDDSRYYHQCRINQTLHLASAFSFVAAYALARCKVWLMRHWW